MHNNLEVSKLSATMFSKILEKYSTVKQLSAKNFAKLIL